MDIALAVGTGQLPAHDSTAVTDTGASLSQSSEDGLTPTAITVDPKMVTESVPVTLVIRPPPEALAETLAAPLPTGAFDATDTVKVIGSLVLAVRPVLRVQVNVLKVQSQPVVAGFVPAMAVAAKLGGSTAVRISDGLLGLVVLVFDTLMVKVSALSPCVNVVGALVTTTELVGATSGETNVDRSNRLNKSSCSCGVKALPRAGHSLGNSVPGVMLVSNTWYSLNSTRPH